MVKKALEILDEDSSNEFQEKKKKHGTTTKKKSKSTSLDRKQIGRTCLALKRLSKPVVSSDQVEQFNNYRFGGPSKRDLQSKKKQTKEDEVFTEEDFRRFEREYNPPIKNV